jgi:DNA replication ATP-dependent helicase/nuclease Dna2
MLDQEELVQFYYEEAYLIYKSEEFDNAKKILQMRELLSSFIRKTTAREDIFFSSFYTRIIYITAKYQFPEELSKRLKTFRFFSSKVTAKSDVYQNDLDYSLRVLVDTVFFIANEVAGDEILSVLAEFSHTKLTSYSEYTVEDNIDFMQVRAISGGDKFGGSKDRKAYQELVCESLDGVEYTIRFHHPWLDISTFVRKGNHLNLIDFRLASENKFLILSHKDSLVVFEPDHLIDVTDIAECFTSEGHNVNIHFLKKFMKKPIGLPIVAGNLVNSIYDELIADREVDFEEAYQRAMKIKPMQLFALASEDPELLKVLRAKVHTHYNNLKTLLDKEENEIFSVEPSFISAKYGLQGRLDLLKEYMEDENRKDVVELKSGKPPSIDISVRHSSGQRIRTGTWENNLAQVTCYNLLLDSTFPNRIGSSQILYSSAAAYPMRDVPNIVFKKQDVLTARNWIVAIENGLSKDVFSIFEVLNPNTFGFRPSYVDPQLYDFAVLLNSSSDLEKEYFFNFTAFVNREIETAKKGTYSENESAGFSAMWKKTIFAKQQDSRILSELELLPDESDFENLHLTFKRTEFSNSVSSLRLGDMVIAYRAYDQHNPLGQQLVKGSIRQLDKSRILVSVRNKLINRNLFEECENWVLESDYSDALNKRQFPSMLEFLQASREKKDLIFGKLQPKIADRDVKEYEELNDSQEKLVNQAIAAEDYFIIQGPPGTGKTSYMLKTLVEEINKETEEILLVLAYTNRAVDEISQSLAKIESEEFSFLRLGTKECTDQKDLLIAHLAESMSVNELYKTIRQSRVIISTVASVLSNPELMQIKSFDTVIIDEASQILEPQIVGIISKIKRFILIGDERQLPAVVIQSQEFTRIDNEHLNEIGLNNLSNSLFERLLNQCKKNEWLESFGMLDEQARMNSEIMDLANRFFYDSKLKRYEGLSEQNLYLNEGATELDGLLLGNPLLFFESKSTNSISLISPESLLAAKLISKIVDLLGESFQSDSIGVIAPFRASCAEIYRMLAEEISDKVIIDTVERFQGSEKEIILLVLPLRNSLQLENIQSLTEIDGKWIDRKLNVAITRAKQQLIIIGNPAILQDSVIYSNIIDYFGERGLLHSSSIIDE